MRIYLPATLDLLRGDLRLRGAAHAITPALRAALSDEDEEGLEFVAQLAAADDSLLLLAADAEAPRLRVVVAADVPDPAVGSDAGPGGQGPSGVTVGEVTRAQVVCALVDEPSAAADVAAALGGDGAARDRLDEHDLLWYDVVELDAIPRA